jgi:hypothetical protein
MQNKTLEDFIASLSAEEREKHQALIRECIDRKRVINENAAKMFESVDKLSSSMQKLRQGLKYIKQTSELHKDVTRKLLSDLVPLLRTLPGNKQSMN